jgi:hypothetical protein
MHEYQSPQEMKKVGIDMSRFEVKKEKDHALQRVIENLVEADIFKMEDKKWGAGYWRSLLKRYCKKYNKTYVELEVIVGRDHPSGRYGLLKELRDVPSKYPRYGWLRNKLK